VSAELVPSASKIGARFSLVTAIPTTTLLLFVVGLLLTGAPQDAPDLAVAADRVRDWNAIQVALLVIAGTALGLLLHPFQVRVVKVLEGYWPSHVPVGLLRASSEARYRRRQRALQELARTEKPLNRWEARHPGLIERRREDARSRLAAMPFDEERVLGTRLGNTLRASEDLAGARYYLESVEVIPRLYPIAPPVMVDLIEDARSQMDVMASFVLVSMLATAYGLVMLAPYGPWLAVPVVTYLLAWGCYRSCVTAAAAYGRTLMWAIDLYRFELIEQLRYEPAKNAADERVRNLQIMGVLTGERFLNPPVEEVREPLAYVHAPAKATVEICRKVDKPAEETPQPTRANEKQAGTPAAAADRRTRRPSAAENAARTQRVLDAAAFFAAEGERRGLRTDRVIVRYRDTVLRKLLREWSPRAGAGPAARAIHGRGWLIRPGRGRSVDRPRTSSVTITSGGRVLMDVEWEAGIRELATRTDRDARPPMFPIDALDDWRELVSDVHAELRRRLRLASGGKVDREVEEGIARAEQRLLEPLAAGSTES
jgi:hypothetical protein